MKKKKLVRTSTVASTLTVFCFEQIKRLSSKYDVHIITSPDSILEKFKGIDGVTVHTVEMQRHISIFKDIVSLFKLASLLNKIKPDIVHSISPKAGLLSMIASKMIGVKYRIHTFTGLVWPTSAGVKKKILVFTDKLLCKCATHLIPESFSVKQAMQGGNITNKELTILGNGSLRGINMDYYNINTLFKKYKNANLKSFVYVYIGRIVGDKGINEMVEAFDNVTKRCSDVTLLLVGAREDNLDPLKEKTNSIINANPDIIEIGQVQDVRPYIAVSNVLLLPSYREGLPNSVLESGAMGVPSIVSDIPGCSELVTNNVTGIIVKVKSISELEKAMIFAHNNPEKMKELGANMRKNVAEKYNSDYVYSDLETFYDELT